MRPSFFCPELLLSVSTSVFLGGYIRRPAKPHAPRRPRYTVHAPLQRAVLAPLRVRRNGAQYRSYTHFHFLQEAQGARV